MPGRRRFRRVTHATASTTAHSSAHRAQQRNDADRPGESQRRPEVEHQHQEHDAANAARRAGHARRQRAALVEPVVL
ncbi:hypothetical protein ARSEF4850_007409 [Beauveria asiatica]